MEAAGIEPAPLQDADRLMTRDFRPNHLFNPHTDSMQVAGGCASCTKGHGVSGSPMLRAPQHEVCLGCHDSQSRTDLKKRPEHPE